MSKKSILPQTRHHVWLYDSDWEYLLTRFGQKLGPSKCVRDVIHSWVARLKEKENAELSSTPRESNEVKS